MSKKWKLFYFVHILYETYMRVCNKKCRNNNLLPILFRSNNKKTKNYGNIS